MIALRRSDSMSRIRNAIASAHWYDRPMSTSSSSNSAGTQSGLPDQPWDSTSVQATLDELSSLRRDLIALQTGLEETLRAVHPAFTPSAVNLVHYVGLRQHDVRDLQQRLATFGLSSFGCSEFHVFANIDKVFGVLYRLPSAACVE